MDVVTEFTMGIWEEVVATVGIGTVGLKFTGAIAIGLIGMGWEIALILYLLLLGPLIHLFFSSDILGPRTFLMGLLFWARLVWEGELVFGCDCVWGWGLGLG